MDIRLNYLRVENFKGIKAFTANLDGDNAVIKAANGIGKTTIYDAFNYLLFGKDSSGRKDFAIRPLDDDNQPIKGLTLAVEAALIVDGVVVILRKEQKEKVIKNQITGYETFCSIDEVPTKVSDFNDYISKIIPEETFKALTDLHYFNGKLHWTERRKMLLDIAGEISAPQGFDSLLVAKGNRSIDDYKKVLLDQKKRLVKSRDEINPRIDEIQKGLDGYAGNGNTAKMEASRMGIQDEINTLDKQRDNLMRSERERQAKIDRMNNLKRDRAVRESQLKSDTSGVQALIEERQELTISLSNMAAEVREAESLVTIKIADIDLTKKGLANALKGLEDARQEYLKLSQKEEDCTCPMCKQALPEGMVKEIQAQRIIRLKDITSKGNEFNNTIEQYQQRVDLSNVELNELKENAKRLNEELVVARANQQARLAEIQQVVDSRETPKPENDPAWQSINNAIAQIETEIGEPMTTQLQTIEESRRAKQFELSALDRSLAQVDRKKQDEQRIVELEEQEKQIAQQIADCDNLLAQIEQFKAAESIAIETAVNGRFKYVNFKLFKENLNGSIEEDCMATLNGVPYPDMSYGQKIVVGIDIVNVLSGHFGVSVPIFVDNAESLTLSLEATSQTIELYALKSARMLTLVKKEVVANV